MLYIFGDSHAEFNFKNLKHFHENLRHYSITMHRIGRDNTIINFDKSYNSIDNIFILCYGEVDCRCYIKKQLLLNDKLSSTEIIHKLVDAYFATIKNNINEYKKIIICSVTPPQSQAKYEMLNGPITHEFPFVGSDEERVEYTKYMNTYISQKCQEHDYLFFDIYDHYANEDGILNWDLSDKICHIAKNEFILDKLEEILNK
jgi:hypothetical protein